MSQTTILCVDPDRQEREATTAELRQRFDAEVVSAGSLSTARELLRERAIDCIVTEYEFPEGTGLDLTESVRGVEPDAGCILYTTADREVLRNDSHEETIVEYVNKDAPGADEQLAQLVETIVAFHTQTSYPIPQNEADRVAAIEAYELDDPDLAATIEKITDLAAQHFDAPKSSVNIIKEHSQEFLACHGSEWTPTDREDSICTYAILDDEPVTFIEDTQEDPRFENNDALRDLGIRSYAGASLETEEGLEIGTLCVYDDEPRSFTSEQATFLDGLADVAMDVIELHADVAQLRRVGGDHADGDRAGGELETGGETR